MSGTKQFFSGLDEAGLARLLREMADRLEGVAPETEDAFGVETGDFFKLKLSLKRELDGYAAKLKSKPYNPAKAYPAPCAGAVPAVPEAAPSGTSETSPPKYKSLKKRMKGQFKSIYDSLINNALPAAPLVEAFLADSERMIAYPGYGDEFYGEYDALCTAFREAFGREDLDGCKRAVQDLNRLKKECHDRCK